MYLFENVDLIHLSNVTYDKCSNSLSYNCNNKNIKLSLKNKKDVYKFLNDRKCNFRLCLNIDSNENYHNMIICDIKNNYFPPHKHKNTDETLHVIFGELIILVFEDDGNIIKADTLIKGEIIRIPKETYHMIIAKTKYAIYAESKLGPHLRENTAMAHWAPDNNNSKGVIFINNIIKSL